jgi:hypothetical protein
VVAEIIVSRHFASNRIRPVSFVFNLLAGSNYWQVLFGFILVVFIYFCSMKWENW